MNKNKTHTIKKTTNESKKHRHTQHKQQDKPRQQKTTSKKAKRATLSTQ